MIKKLQGMIETIGENTLYYNVGTDIIDSVSDSEELVSHIKDILNYGCQSGCVSSQIYYRDTQKFFDNNQEEIFELLNDIREEYGLSENFEINSNNLSWLAYEETTRRIANDLDIEY